MSIYTFKKTRDQVLILFLTMFVQEPSGADPLTWASRVGTFDIKTIKNTVKIKFPQDQSIKLSVCMSVCVSVESMSLRSIGNPGDLSSRLMDNDKARDCIIPMG